jgi:hypothetical protein
LRCARFHVALRRPGVQTAQREPDVEKQGGFVIYHSKPATRVCYAGDRVGEGSACTPRLWKARSLEHTAWEPPSPRTPLDRVRNHQYSPPGRRLLLNPQAYGLWIVRKASDADYGRYSCSIRSYVVGDGMADETVVLVCNPDLSGNEIPGSVETVCAECGNPVLLAPSGQRIQDTQDPKLVCVKCANAHHAGWGGVVVPPNDQQVAELEAFWKWWLK